MADPKLAVPTAAEFKIMATALAVYGQTIVRKSKAESNPAIKEILDRDVAVIDELQVRVRNFSLSF